MLCWAWCPRGIGKLAGPRLNRALCMALSPFCVGEWRREVFVIEGGLWRLPDEGTGDVGSARALLARGRAVRVLEDECECDEAGGRSTGAGGPCPAVSNGGEGESEVSSGFAIRRPPSVWDRLISLPFMAAAAAAAGTP